MDVNSTSSGADIIEQHQSRSACYQSFYGVALRVGQFTKLFQFQRLRDLTSPYIKVEA